MSFPRPKDLKLFHRSKSDRHRRQHTRRRTVPAASAQVMGVMENTDDTMVKGITDPVEECMWGKEVILLTELVELRVPI